MSSHKTVKKQAKPQQPSKFKTIDARLHSTAKSRRTFRFGGFYAGYFLFIMIIQLRGAGGAVIAGLTRNDEILS